MQIDLIRTVEALLFASPEPLSLDSMKAVIPGTDKRALRQAMQDLEAGYRSENRAFQLREVGGGWRIVTLPEHSRSIEKLLKRKRRVRLSRAGLETLAVIAYRQPCTRFDADKVRGVNCAGALATLLEKGLIRILGRAETLGKPLLYGTTDAFLDHLGIPSIEELPNLAEVEALLAGREEENGLAPEERRQKILDGISSIEERMDIQQEEPESDNLPLTDGESEVAADPDDDMTLLEAIQIDFREEKQALESPVQPGEPDMEQPAEVEESIPESHP